MIETVNALHPEKAAAAQRIVYASTDREEDACYPCGVLFSAPAALSTGRYPGCAGHGAGRRKFLKKSAGNY